MTLYNTSNFPRSSDNDSGTNEFRLQLSEDNVTFTTVVDDTLAELPGGTNPTVFALNNDRARYVKFVVDSVHTGDTRGGLNELELDGTLVPEPASLAIVGVAVGLIARRRRA